jgi:Na+(H+)/acetate symporter ActP
MEERFLGGAPIHAEPTRRERPFLRMVAMGLARLAGLVAVAAAIAAGAGLLIGWLRGDDLWTAVTYSLYIGGVILVGLALFGGGRQVQWRGELGEDLGPGGERSARAP